MNDEISSVRFWFARWPDDNEFDYCVKEKCIVFNGSNSIGDMNALGSDIESFGRSLGLGRAPYKTTVHYTYWQLSHVVRKDDVIIYFKSPSEVRGWGIVTSPYTYDESRLHHHSVGVDWKIVSGITDSPVRHASGLWFKEKNLTELRPLLGLLGYDVSACTKNEKPISCNAINVKIPNQNHTEKSIFISHSSDDDEISERFYQYLEEHGVGCWMDKHDIVPGIPYARAIMQGIDSCKAMIVLLSSKSIKSDDVLNEVDQAHHENKFLFPIFIEDVELPRDFKYYLARRQWIKAYNDIENGMSELCKALTANLGIELQDKSQEELKKAKAELVQLARNYSNKVAQLSNDAKEINAKMRSIGITERICPVCHSRVSLGNLNCHTCGWYISPLEGIEGVEYLLSDAQQYVKLAREIWNKAETKS